MPPALASAANADVVLLHPSDNILVAARPLATGSRLAAADDPLTLVDNVAMGHKLARQPIPRGQHVIKYGQVIGFATTDIAPGQWVHTHNLANGEVQRDYAFASAIPPEPTPLTGRTFQGYRRADGRAGTRNYVAVISSVNCSASVSKYIAQRFDARLLADYPHIDGILPIIHKSGCGMQFGGDDHQQLTRVLGGFARHPNIGAYLLVGLGCETGQVAHLVEQAHLVHLDGARSGGGQPGAPPVLVMQDLGGTTRTVEAGLRALAELLPRAGDVRRTTIPASELVLGLECGGSDGWSGVTANPALGFASDLLVAAGGTSILSETPEVYGAEHLLTRRARTRAIGEKLIERIRWWERYTSAFGVEIDNNPTPGNKAGGLTTIFEKSLGAVAKGGTAALAGVYRYGEPIDTRGFVFMDSPGYDPASVTGLVASGANVVCFTTGRGSCFGCKPVPSIKIATNTPMYERMVDDMDVNAGKILSGTPLAAVGEEIFELILEVASGRRPKSEAHGIGEEEFCPWSIGPTL